MRTEKTVKPLPYKKELTGLSKRQIDEHHDVLYAGYIKKINEIETKLESADPSEANPTFSLIGELKREQVFCTNAVSLHENYFANMGGEGNQATGTIAEFIKQDYGSYEKWETDFKAAGVAARGWVVLAYNLYDNRVWNYSTDVHTQGVWGAVPLLIMDVYEHAYMIDYGTARKNYIETFFKNINWDYVNQTIEQYGLVQRRSAAVR